MLYRNDLPPALPLGLPGVSSDDNPYRLKKSQIGSYKPTTATPFQAPTPFMSAGVQPTQAAPLPSAYESTQQQIHTQSGNLYY